MCFLSSTGFLPTLSSSGETSPKVPTLSEGLIGTKSVCKWSAKDLDTISNDGATVLGLLDIEHAAAKILVDIAKSQDNEVGDGTTTVTILAGELMKNAKGFI